MSFSIGGFGISYEKMVINNNGNVGIGTTSPTNTLDVAGSADVWTNLYVGGNIQAARFSTTNGGGGIAIGGTTNLMIQTNAIGPHGYTLQFTNGLFINAIAY